MKNLNIKLKISSQTTNEKKTHNLSSRYVPHVFFNKYDTVSKLSGKF